MNEPDSRTTFADVALAFERRGWLGTILFDRAEKKNAFSQKMWAALPDMVAGIKADEQIRVVIVRGAGGTFCAGADISEFAEIYADRASSDRANEIIRNAQRALRALPRPTIALVEGACVGGGCGLALACDLRFVAGSARFGITPARLGLAYSFHDTMQLVEKVGAAAAKDILFSGRLFDGGEALRIGLVDRVFAPSALEAETLAYATQLSELAQGSIRIAKAAINALSDHLADQLSPQYADRVSATFDSADFLEGRRAFLEGRRPRFGDPSQ
jgi:enoyl-CoA hydratase/carnithine racemase